MDPSPSCAIPHLGTENLSMSFSYLCSCLKREFLFSCVSQVELSSARFKTGVSPPGGLGDILPATSSFMPGYIVKNLNIHTDKFSIFPAKEALANNSGNSLSYGLWAGVLSLKGQHISSLKTKQSLLSSNIYLCRYRCLALGHMTEQISHLMED